MKLSALSLLLLAGCVAEKPAADPRLQVYMLCQPLPDKPALLCRGIAEPAEDRL